MAKYINADALVKRIDEALCKPCRDEKQDYRGVRCRACWVDDMLIWIDSEPAADVREVVHGHWVKVPGFATPGGDPVWGCSECGKGVHVYGIEANTYAADVADHQWIACPNCGAIMDEVTE